MSDKDLKWIDELKAGDAVVVQRLNWGCPYEKYTVVRLTATQVVMTTSHSHEVRARRKDGFLIGNWSHSYPRLTQHTVEIAERIAQWDLAAEIGRLKEDELRKLPSATLRAMLALYRGVQQEKQNET